MKEMEKPDIHPLFKTLYDLKADIEDSFVDGPDDEPHIDITLACDERGWGLQTGDNSFFGNAYGYRHWGTGSLCRDTDTKKLAEDLIEQCQEQFDESQSGPDVF